MNTSGHHSVATEAGEPVLRAACERIGMGKAPLHAFYLGNWLTDVGQAVDPVAYASFSKKVRGLVNTIASYLPADNPLTGPIREKYDGLASDIYRLLDLYLKPPGSSKEQLRQSKAAQAFRKSFFVLGYFKFACPHQPDTMRGDAYIQVFDKLYGQYYPHEHMDRPESAYAPSSVVRGGSKNEVVDAPGTNDSLSGSTRSKFRKQTLTPDMYSYLREDIEIAAGVLADLDLKWAAKYLRPGGAAIDADWHLGLARFGYGLHAIEDFFAHSNFAERAVLTFPADEVKRLVPADGESQTLFRRRRKIMLSYKQALRSDWEREADDLKVVTGFFDFQDTAVSLGHIAENLFLEKHGTEKHRTKHVVPPNPRAHANFFFRETLQGADVRQRYDKMEDESKCSKPFKALFTDLLEFVSDPKGTADDKDNQVARFYKGKKPPTDPAQMTREVIANSPLFRDVPQRVKDDFVDAVVLFSTTGTVGGQSVNLYQFLKHITEALDAPVKFVQYFLSEFLGLPILAEEVAKAVSKAVFDTIAATRLGCHSLMAKDHGPDGLLYDVQRQCSLAVHWYAVSAMVRRTARKPLVVCRSTPGQGDGKKFNNTIDESEPWIDWLELLEFYLRNPASTASSGGSEPVLTSTIDYIVQEGDSLASLAEKFRPTSGAPAQFTWRSIARATYDTDVPEEINRELRERGDGVLTSDGVNYKFKPGVRVRIPDQKWSVPAVEAANPERAWFRPVMTSRQGWRSITEPEECEVAPGKKFVRHILFPVKKSDVETLASDATKLRDAAERAYMPK